MATERTVCVTADLHWGHRRGSDATQALVAFVYERRPDVFIIAGDIGTGAHFEACLELFADLDCVKALVVGNHDLWVPHDAAHDSLTAYERLLPEVAARWGFHYLDAGPLVLPDAGLGIVGTVNWYDYSWAIDAIRQWYPEEEHRLRSKRFTRGRHNDANFVRWPLDDAGFTALVQTQLANHLQQALASTERLIVIAHHPPFYGLSFPRDLPPVMLDSFLWDAFAGNCGVEQLLASHAEKIAFAFCGHTHRARENTLGAIRGYNVGGDYHFKRLLWLTWPTGTVEAHQFGEV